MSVTLPPLQKVVGPPGVIVGTNVPSGTVVLPFALQPFASVICTVSPTLPLPFGVKLMVLVPAPAVMAAFVAPQVKVAPALAGTDALALALAHVEAGAEIVAFGGGLTVTVAGDESALQLFA
ncbi:MAG TPA: hypothetical protein VNN08_17445 [Thermoanaerobaculia bacterium]|nr:hypothetical protein [Thermoanaerobaculia bacterium]